MKSRLDLGYRLFGKFRVYCTYTDSSCYVHVEDMLSHKSMRLLEYALEDASFPAAYLNDKRLLVIGYYEGKTYVEYIFDTSFQRVGMNMQPVSQRFVGRKE